MKALKDKLTVLVTLEPTSYRDVIGSVIQMLRPNLDVEVVGPDDLLSEVGRLAPDLVICSHHKRLMPANREPAWIEFHPYTEPTALHVNGKRRHIGKPVELADLLAVVDDLSRGFPEAV